METNTSKVARKKFDTQKLLAPSALVVLYIFFAIFGKNFLSFDTLRTILESSYYIGFMAFGVTFVIITGGIDLSLGSVMMCAGLIGGIAFNPTGWGWPLWAALLLLPLVGMIFGLANGLMIAKLKLPPFIATLGTQMISLALGDIITNTQTQRYPTVGSDNAWFKEVFFRINTDNGGVIPIGVVYLLVAFFIALFLLRKTRFGRYSFAIGSNEEAARLSGVNVDKWKTLVYVVNGLFVGFSALFYAATYTTVIPSTGNGQEMNGIAAVVIGGTSMSGGSGTLVGTLIGVFIMAVLKTGLPALGLGAPYQKLFTGIVVILAVLMDIQRNKAASRVKRGS